MQQENDFAHIDTTFFTTSQTGQLGPDLAGPAKPLLNAMDFESLAKMDIIITWQQMVILVMLLRIQEILVIK